METQTVIFLQDVIATCVVTTPFGELVFLLEWQQKTASYVLSPSNSTSHSSAPSLSSRRDVREDARGAQAGPLAVRLDRDVRIVQRAAQIGGGGVEENDGLGDSVTIIVSPFFKGIVLVGPKRASAWLNRYHRPAIARGVSEKCQCSYMQ